MAFRYIIFSILLILLGACCRGESEEAASYPLSPKVQSLIPYTSEQEIDFLHSNGYAFTMHVVESSVQWEKESNFCEWSCCDNDYYSFQQKTVSLSSTEPNFFLTITLGDDWWTDFNKEITFRLHNNYCALAYDSTGCLLTSDLVQYHDSLVIPEVTYQDVYALPFLNAKDSLSLDFDTLYYSTLGIIQIKMTNGETYTALY